MKVAREYGVRGFPTIFFVDDAGNQEKIYGSKPYALYEAAILELSPNIEKSEYKKDWETLFTKYNSLTAKEFSVLSGMPRANSETKLNELTKLRKLEKLSTKNGSIWTVII